MERLFFIDIARFLAIFFVTGFHAARFIGFDNLHSFGGIFKNMFMTGGWLGCCLFFLISGYCLCINYNENVKYFDFIRKRLIKILPAYYIAMTIWYFLVKTGITTKAIGISAILSHIFLVHVFDNANFYSICGVFWFLGVLFNFYLIFPFLYKIQKNTKYLLEIFTLLIFIVCLFISFYFHIEGSVFNKSIFINLPCFVFGMMLYNRPLPEFFKNKWLKLILLFITFNLLIFAKSGGFMGTPINLLAIVESILIGLVCVLYKMELEKLPDLLKNFVTQIAVASYSIYLYNYIFLATKPLHRNSTTVFIYIFLIFGFGLCMYMMIEKPVNKLIKNIK